MKDCAFLRNKPRKDGYVRTTWDGKHQYAHRYYYEKQYGLIPKELEIDHICNNRACINVEHLRAVSHLENMSHARTRWLHTGFCKKGHDLNTVGMIGEPPKGPTCKECRRQAIQAWRKRKAL